MPQKNLSNHFRVRYLYLKDQKLKKCQNYQQYIIADSVYQSDTKLPELEHLLRDQIVSDKSNNATNPAQINKLTFKQKTQIGETQYNLQVYTNSSHYLLKHKSHNYIIEKEQVSTNINNTDITLLMGPVIILNLALNDVYCLHASVFILKETTFIVMANSGTGKSTIARFMGTQVDGRRIADDIIPLKIINKSLTVLPNFPQLKLKQQRFQHHNTSKKIILLFAETHENETRIDKIDKMSSIKKLINHTVAAKLFGDKELNSHLNFCYQASQQSQNYLLKYQHSRNSLQKLYGQLYEMC